MRLCRGSVICRAGPPCGSVTMRIISCRWTSRILNGEMPRRKSFKILKVHWLAISGEFAGCRAYGLPSAPCSDVHVVGGL